MHRKSHRIAILSLTASLAALLSAIILIAYGTSSSTIAPISSHAGKATPDMSAPNPEPTSISRSILGLESEIKLTSMMFVPMARIADALRALAPLLGDPQLGDADWTAQVALQIDTIHTAYGHLWDLELLLMENEFYYQTVGATGWCDRAADHLEVAIEEVRNDKLHRAHDLFQHCRAQLKQLGSSALIVGN